MKIGYDFDGVFHTNVNNENVLGERTHIEGKNLIPFYVILDRIRQEVIDGHEVFIISRNNRIEVVDNLKKLAIDSFFKDENIIADLGSKDIPKSKIIKEYKIEVFFDDSVYNIHEINREKKKKNLNTKLYLVDPELELYKRIKSKNLKILSYNVNWEYMKSEKTAIKECRTKDICALNNNNLILNELPLDFIFIQEIANKNVLLKDLQKDFRIVKTKSEKESMVILVNKKYNVDITIGGEFEEGRPFLVVFLKEGICLVNVHMGHKINVIRELKKIEDEIYKTKINMDSYRIILGGDFNANVGKEILFFEKRMLNFRKKTTCCINSSHISKNKSTIKDLRGKNIDHILDSEAEPIYGNIIVPTDENNNILPSSDHFAVYAELQALN